MAQNETTEQSLQAFREERYEEMRFTPKEATRLAKSRQSNGFHLDYRKVKRAIENGLSHKQAVNLFAEDEEAAVATGD